MHRNEGWILFLWTGKVPCKKANFSYWSHQCLLTSIFYIKISPHFTLCCLVRGYFDIPASSAVWALHKEQMQFHGVLGYIITYPLSRCCWCHSIGKWGSICCRSCKHDTINALQKCVYNKYFIHIHNVLVSRDLLLIIDTGIHVWICQYQSLYFYSTYSCSMAAKAINFSLTLLAIQLICHF